MLQNPGPKDDDTDNIMREVLNIQDLEYFGNDMCEEDPLSIQVDNQSTRKTVLHALKQLTVVKNHDLVANILPIHQKEEYMKHIRKLEYMTAKCLEISYSSPNHDVYDNPVPSTSGNNTRVSQDLSCFRVNDSLLYSSTSFDEHHFGTQNKDHLETQLQVEIIDNSISYETLPDIQLTANDLTANEDKQEDLQVTRFRAANEEKQEDLQGFPLQVTTFRAINEDDKTKRRSRREKFNIKFDLHSSSSDSE